MKQSSLYLLRQIQDLLLEKGSTLIKILLSEFTGHCYLVNLLGIALQCIAVWSPRIHLLLVEKVTCDIEIDLGIRRNDYKICIPAALPLAIEIFWHLIRFP